MFADDAPAATFGATGVERITREGRVLNILCSGDSDRVLQEARQFQPASVEVTPVTLKEIFLETVGRED